MKENLTQTITQRTLQRLSPLQMRFVRMLEMSEPEVEEEVRRELDDNPALELADSPDNSPEETFHETAEDIQRADYRSEDDIPFYRFEARNHSADDRWYEPVAVADEGSLSDVLMTQLAETDIPEQDLPIAEYIIGNLDNNGYLTRSLTEIEDDLAFNAGIDAGPEKVREVFERVRALDPAGIGALDLRDCLMLQLKRLKESADVTLASNIVSRHFDLFSLHRFDRLETLLHTDRTALRRAVELIRSLDPKPASKIADSDDIRTRHIIPDFIVEPGDDDDSLIVTMPNNVPDLVIEQSFRPESQIVRRESGSRKNDAISFIARKREEASDFIDLLRQRRNTLMKVMGAILQKQREFFTTSDESTLRPMVLKDIAALTGFDISVISRATSGKYVATPTSIYPLKFFFNEGLPTDGADERSTQAVLAAISELIATEPPESPLSDEALLQALKERGYELARRTVAKYRDRLGIPIARLRKKI